MRRSSFRSMVMTGGGDLYQLGYAEFAGSGAGRRRHIRQLVEEFSESRQPILHGCDLCVVERDLLPHPLEVGSAFEQMSTRGTFCDVEAALCAGHAVRTLVEEVVAAKPVTQVVV